MSKKKRVLLFDLGGVLADLGTPTSDMGLDMTEEAFWATWLNSENVHAFEMGKLDAPEFCRRIAGELGQEDTDTFEERLRAWRLTLFPGVADLIRSIPQTIPIALLSNTNEIHWDPLATAGVFTRFDQLFLSYETGHYKPMQSAFEQVTARFGCDPDDVLFLDDSPRNVAAAIETGFDAHRVYGVTESRAVIERELLVRPT
jgi:HAD superfamily hydrolase (TIGR01509 family)